MNLKRLAFFVAVLAIAPFVFADHAININTADQATLETLTGIGPTKAQAIIDYRTQHGSFATIEEIQNVSGIGPATYDGIKDHITVQGGNSSSPSPAPAPPPSPSPSGAASPPPSTSSSSALSLDGGGDRVVIVGADAQFSAKAYSGKAAIENAAYLWNFGDGTTAPGAHVTHRFEYAGRYAIVLTGSYDGSTASDNFSVNAVAAELSLHVLPDGSVEIENLATRDADLSRWTILSKGQRFTLPLNSLVLGKQTMHISPATLHFYASDSSELAYPSGAIAFAASSAGEGTPPPPTSSPLPPLVETNPSSVVAQVRTTPTAPIPTPKSEEVAQLEQDTQIATSSQFAAASARSGSWPWWVGAASISFGAAAAIFVSRRFGKKEWEIIEDTAE